MLSCSLLKFLDVVAETQQTQPCVSHRRGPQSGLLVLNPSASRFHRDAHLGWNEWLFELVMPSCKPGAVVLFSPDINKTYLRRDLLRPPLFQTSLCKH